MRVIILDFSGIMDMQNLHKLLKEKLQFPDYYGNNLDALWDCLSQIREYTLVELKNVDELYINLGTYAAKTLNVLDDMTQENPYLWLKLIAER